MAAATYFPMKATMHYPECYLGSISKLPYLAKPKDIFFGGFCYPPKRRWTLARSPICRVVEISCAARGAISPPTLDSYATVSSVAGGSVLIIWRATSFPSMNKQVGRTTGTHRYSFSTQPRIAHAHLPPDRRQEDRIPSSSCRVAHSKTARTQCLLRMHTFRASSPFLQYPTRFRTSLLFQKVDQCHAVSPRL
ncbi:hypothetical protein BDV96DRAFT_601920 [Lophiotrema nucula]|uniref:Uncharacterized protein n=1 Tax=Lophiotrema nucula TaxID=690887 RepID=A0A6A5YZC9_9PLEO|nr:hypothetical protein BDV96DRAFT_601920 [Lophiotrema nucula]